mmetsp:Transcript_19618/g.43478  ORF Transcript_19618/g.43478 Transcript_19618/m.43478 type:complete len:291 (+) Transcript_19618:780-1652(+)
MHGSTPSLASSQQPLHNFVLASLVLNHLRLPVGRDAPHVVMHGGKYRNRLLGHINAGKNLRRLTDPRQALTQSLRRQVVQMQIDVVFVGTDATPLPDLHSHGPRHHITRCQILRSWRIGCHEGITVGVLQNPSFTSAPLGHQATSRKNSSWVELNKLQILKRQTLPRHSTASVPGASVSGSARVVTPPEPSSCDHRAVCTEPVQSTVLHGHGNAANAVPRVVHQQVHQKIFDEKKAIVLQSHAVEGVQNRVPCAVSGGGAPVRLSSLSELQALAAKGPLVNFSLIGAGER